jgi:eukaryotic-like serine/threonine-protein kinase
VMGRLAGALTFSPQQERKYALFDEAVAIANRIGDKRALATVSMARLVALWGSLPLAEIRGELARLMQLFVDLGDERFVHVALLQHGVLAAESGDPDTAAAIFAEGERHRASIRHPGLRWLMSMLCSGWKLRAARPSEAERIAEETFETSGIVGENQVAFLVLIVQRMMILWQQGRMDETAAMWAKAVATAHYSNTLSIERVAALFIAAEVGRSADARAMLDRVSVATIYRDSFWAAKIVMCARAIEKIDDAARAREFYDMLSRFDDRVADAGGAVYIGSISGALGLLAKTLSRFDDAVRHFEAALVIERGMPILLARTRCELARILSLRAAPGDRVRALGLLGDAIEGAREYEMNQVVADALALKLELEGAATTSPRSSIDVVTASLEAKGVDVGRATAPNGTVTLVFTDIEGFGEMTERLGDAGAHRLMLAHNEIIRRELATHEGTEVAAQGDGFLLAFPSATDALRYTIAVQRVFAAHRADRPDEPIHVRMGLNTGEPIREGDRFFGKTVVLASRISAHARGDEILVSSVVRELAEASGEFAFDAGEEVTLAGLAGRHRVYALVWDPTAPPRRAAPTVVPTSAENVFRREGDFWTVAYAGRSSRLKDARGLQFLSVLLRRQGEEVHVLDLVEIASRYGVGGRRAASDVERARKAVSSRVSNSIARIRKENPELGAHLGNSVRLGLLCRYEPERPVAWSA